MFEVSAPGFGRPLVNAMIAADAPDELVPILDA